MSSLSSKRKGGGVSNEHRLPTGENGTEGRQRSLRMRTWFEAGGAGRVGRGGGMED